MRILGIRPFVDEIKKFQTTPKLAHSRTLLCLDLGTRNIGVAKCDLHFYQILPSNAIVRKIGIDMKDEHEKLSKTLQRSIDEHNAVGIVVGFPLNMDNSLSKWTKRIIYDMSRLNCFYPPKISDELASANESIDVPGTKTNTTTTRLPMICTFWDERETTYHAKAVIRTQLSSRKSVVNSLKDAYSAVLILDDFKRNVLQPK